MYPNSSNDIHLLHLPANITNNEVITELYGIGGALIRTGKHQQVVNSFKLYISSKPRGIYFLRVITEEVVSTLKLIEN